MTPKLSDVYNVAVTRLAYLEVANRLRDRILEGRITVGSRLPSEPELCEEFGVSRSTIREALRMLSSQKLVRTSRGVGGGSSVARLEIGDVTDMLRDSILHFSNVEGCTVEELLEAREFLEVPAARLAAKRHAEIDIAHLRESIPDDLEEVMIDRIYEVNRAFHESLLDAAGNRLLHVVTKPLFTVMQTRFLRGKATIEFWQQVMKDHSRILLAVEAGDENLAGQEMTEHLIHLRVTYEAIDTLHRGD